MNQNKLREQLKIIKNYTEIEMHYSQGSRHVF